MDHVKFYYVRLIGHVRLKYFALACKYNLEFY